MAAAKHPLPLSLALHASLALALAILAQTGWQGSRETPFEPISLEMLSEKSPAVAAAPRKLARNDDSLRLAKVTAKTTIEPDLASPSVSESEAVARSGAAAGQAQKTYLSELRTYIERNKQYPRQAKTLGHEGRSEIRFTVLPDGSLCGFEITHSSGSEILDRSALTLIQGAPKLSPFPNELKVSRLDLVLPVEYVLN